MRDQLRLGLPVVVAVVALAACTTTEAGQAVSPPGAPTSGSPESSPAEETSTAPQPTVSIPPRPKDLKLDGVDPCALFTEPQLDQLKITRKRAATSKSETYSGAKECVLDVTTQGASYNYRATAVTTEGIDAWLTGKRNVDVELAAVGDYAAARFVIKGADQGTAFDCSTAVDTAQGQQLQVTMTVNLRGEYTLDQMCQMSEQAAGLAVTTLKTLA